MARKPAPKRRAAKPKAEDRATAYARAVVAGKIVAGAPVRLACGRHLADLKAGPARGLEWRAATAEKALDFFGEVLVLEDGQPFALHPFQCFIVGSLFGWYGPDGFRRFRTAFCEIGKGSGKALALSTPIPTPDGWRAMGDLRPGDLVFDDSGQPTEVLAATAAMHSRECYEMGFDDGERIVADAEHLWATEQRKHGTGRGEALRGVKLSERGGWRYGLRTTRQISDTLRYANGRYRSSNHSILLAAPLELAARPLPVDPYVLGAWLGDGDSDSARITIGEQDAAEMVGALLACGEAVLRRGSMRYVFSDGTRGGSVSARSGTLSARLRKLGVLNNKHIPQGYLRASPQQRLALLQGLCDTDASASSTKRGSVEFVTTLPRLASGFHELLVSLGVKVSMPTANARWCVGVRASDAYRFVFSPPVGMRVFRLGRKQALMGVTTTRRRLSQERRVVTCEPVASVPVRCIQVAAPSGMFLAGRGMVPTHNSPLAAGIGHLGFVADNEPAPEIYVAATMREQAKIVFTDAVRMVEASPELKDLVSVQVGSLSIPSKHAVYRPVSAEHRGLDGLRVHMGLIDELHEHPSALVVDKIRAGTKARRNALLFEITNSGWDRNSVCWNHHEYSLKVLEGVIENDSWFAYVCALDEGDAWTNEAVWVKTNPGVEYGLPPIKYLREQVAEAVGMPTKENLTRRLNFCEWTEQSERAIPMSEWDRAEACAPIDFTALKGRECYGGLDLAKVGDLSAFVLLFPPVAERELWKLLCRFWVPEDDIKRRAERDRVPYDVWLKQGHLKATPGNTTDYGFIEAEVVALASEYVIREIAYDRTFAGEIVQGLADEGLEMVQFGQGFLSMGSPTAELLRMVKAGELQHGGQPVLRWNASNLTVAMDAAGNMKPDKERSVEKIDGISATCNALGRAVLRRPTNVEQDYSVVWA